MTEVVEATQMAVAVQVVVVRAASLSVAVETLAAVEREEAALAELWMTLMPTQMVVLHLSKGHAEEELVALGNTAHRKKLVVKAADLKVEAVVEQPPRVLEPKATAVAESAIAVTAAAAAYKEEEEAADSVIGGAED